MSVVTKSVEVAVGMTLLGVRLAVAPTGSPETVRKMSCDSPLTSVSDTS